MFPGNVSDDVLEEKTASSASIEISINTSELKSANKTTETSRLSQLPEKTELSALATGMDERKSIYTENLPGSLSSIFTNKVEISSTTEPLQKHTANVLTDRVSTLDDAVTSVSLYEDVTNLSKESTPQPSINFTYDNFETTTAVNKMTTTAEVFENSLGTDENLIVDQKNIQTTTSAGDFDTTLVKYTTQTFETVRVTEKVLNGVTLATEKAVTTPDLYNEGNLPISSATEAASDLKTTQDNYQTATEAASDLKTTQDNYQTTTEAASDLKTTQDNYQTTTEAASNLKTTQDNYQTATEAASDLKTTKDNYQTAIEAAVDLKTTQDNYQTATEAASGLKTTQDNYQTAIEAASDLKTTQNNYQTATEAASNLKTTQDNSQAAAEAASDLKTTQDNYQTATEAAVDLKTTQDNYQTATEATEKILTETTTENLLLLTTDETSFQGKSDKSLLEAVKEKQDSLHESVSTTGSMLESTTLSTTGNMLEFTTLSITANGNMFESTPAYTNIPEVAYNSITNNFVDIDFVTNSQTVSSDTNSIATSHSTAVTSIPSLDTSTLSTDILEPQVTKPSVVCPCDAQHASVPHLPSGFHIYPGILFYFRIYCKNPKNLDTRKHCCNHPKIRTKWL